jgi:small subunit ribosomal protein S1
MNYFEPGQLVETKIVAISGDTIFLDLNMKSEGTLDSVELTGPDGKLTVQEGDTVKAYFISSENGEMHFTTKLSGDKADKSVLENAFKNGIPVEGHVEQERKGGYEVKIGACRAFCPYSQMGFREKKEPAFYIGRTLTFKIQEYSQDGRNIIVSNRTILEEAANEKIAQLAQTVKEGMTVSGTVKTLHPYGAFVDINGFQALLPVSEIAITRIDDIHNVLKEGQEIKAKILTVDWAHERMSLSMKALQDDPWDTVTSKYAVGSKYDGSISRIVPFGLFVTLEPGIDGLVHISKLPDTGGNTNLSKVYKTGTKMTVEIEKIDAAERRISLKPTTSVEQDETTEKYMEDQDSSDMYNPFAALLKKK